VFPLLRQWADLYYEAVFCDHGVKESKACLSGDKVAKILEEALSDSEMSLCDSDDDSSVIEYLPIHEAIAIEAGDNAQDKSGLQRGAILTW
jgi:hypothetical protein